MAAGIAGCRAPDGTSGEGAQVTTSRALIGTATLSLRPASLSAISASVSATASQAPKSAPTQGAMVAGLPSLALDPAAQPLACDEAISVGDLTDKCVAAGAWVGTVVLTTGTEIFCRFTWQSTETPRPELLAANGRRVESDCPVVAPASASNVPAGVWQGLSSAYKRQIGSVSWRPAAPVPPVSVFVVDSAVLDYHAVGADDTYGHGRLVGRTIGDLACPQDRYLDSSVTGTSDACSLAIQNVLAVPRIPDPTHPAGIVDTVNGGYFGTRGELVTALETAMESWGAHQATGEHLIVNLSLGWVLPDATAVTSPGPASLVVVRALERASCMGALAIVAAGNQASPSDTGTFFPAAWEGRAAPDRLTCMQTWPSLVLDRDVDNARPLVYAVAALDDQDRLLLTARLGGLPRLGADGLAAVTDDRRQPGHTAILSGSSLAAATVSGVAAAVWQNAPSLTASEIMETVYGAAVDLAAGGVNVTPTNLCLVPPCAPVRRVSLCGALKGIGAGTAVGALNCSDVPAGAGTPPFLPLTRGMSEPSCSTCPPGPPPPPDKPWVWPQPPGSACPSCLFMGSSCSGRPGWVVVGQIDPAFTGSINNMVYKLNVALVSGTGSSSATTQTLAPTSLAGVTSVSARVVRDLAPSDFTLGSNLPSDPFWLEQSGNAAQATISFTIGLANVPGVRKLTTSPQDLPVICQ